MSSNELDLGEQALSKLTEAGISNQLDEVEEINVEIQTDPFKLIQGKVESVTIEGEGLVMQQDLRVETLVLNTAEVAVNPLSVMAGKIELTQPTSADAKVVLTESDLNRALNSSFLQGKLQNLQVEVGGKPVSFDVESAEMRLQEDGSLFIKADIQLQETGQTEQLVAIGKPHIENGGNRIGFHDMLLEETLSPPELTAAVVTRVMELCDLDNFNLKGMNFHLTDLTVQEGEMTLQTVTQIEDIPTL